MFAHHLLGKKLRIRYVLFISGTVNESQFHLSISIYVLYTLFASILNKKSFY